MSPRVDLQTLNLGPHMQSVDRRMGMWQAEGLERRIRQRDHTVWSPQPIPELVDRLGWLDLPETMLPRVAEFETLADAVLADGMQHVVVLGMGGSSLAPEVFAHTLSAASVYPELVVLDSTHPRAVVATESRIDLERTLFVVSSKSGTTLETLSLYRTFWNRVSRTTNTPGRHFVAITDAGTPLQRLGEERQFRDVVNAPSDVGGRYSALTPFGLVPAALIGGDIERLLKAGAAMAGAPDSPGLQLGAALGELAHIGLDKVTFLTSPSLTAFPAWIEQLIAESTGKNGKGILPVESEPQRVSLKYGDDRFFVLISLAEDEATNWNDTEALERAGHPVIKIELGDTSDLGQEMFRWEMAVAAAGAILDINPFDQPDVQLAKELARQAMEKSTEGASSTVAEPVSASRREELSRQLSDWAQAAPGDYVAVQAYLAADAATTKALQELRAKLGALMGVATTTGYGPRFLHSTGQLHKGGPNTGHFLQLIDEPNQDVAVPETDYTFKRLISAQALGDYSALVQRERRVLRVNLGTSAAEGLESVLAALP